MLDDKLAALEEADDSVEKREESHGDEQAGRLIEVGARSGSSNYRTTVWSNATGECVSWPVYWKGGERGER